MIVKVCPPREIVAVRAAVLLFAATLNVTAPLVVPLAPLVIVTQPALLDAVHPHPETLVVTARLDWPPALGAE